MAGLSLVELMIAVALGLLILAALTTVFVNSSTARREIDLTSQQIENGRYAIEILSDDLRLAGYFGELDLQSANEKANDSDDATWLPDVVAPIALPDPCSIPADFKDWRPALYLYLQGYHAPDAATAADITTTTCAPTNLKPGTDVVMVRRAGVCRVGDAGCAAAVDGKPYLQVSLCATESANIPYLLAAGSVAPTLRLKGTAPGACGATGTRRAYMTHVYFISTDNGAGNSVPTLKRLEFDIVAGVLAMKEVSLVEGIEQLNIEYGIDTSGDGVPDVHTSDPSDYPVGACNDLCKVSNWGNVMTARIYVLARNLNTSSGLSDEAKAKTYNLGALTVGPFADGYRRHVYSTVVRIANPAGKRDKPS